MFSLLIATLILAIILIVAHLVLAHFKVEPIIRTLLLLLIAVVIIGLWWTRYGGQNLFY